MPNEMIIKPGVTAEGYRIAVKDYTEPTVVEELAANSYDADAQTVVVLLDSRKNQLFVIDDGNGFTTEAFKIIAQLG
jgi:signal transduction histidine kinase